MGPVQQKYEYFEEGYVDESEDMMVKLKSFFSFGKSLPDKKKEGTDE